MERTLLWWGRSDPAYSRNGVIRTQLKALGWTLRDFQPFSSGWGDLEAFLRRIPRPSAVWVPCFRQRDLMAASRWAHRMGVPLIFDPLISAYDKQVFERKILTENSLRANILLRQEQCQFSQADIVIADTSCHAAFFHEVLGVPRNKLHVVFVGAEESLFRAAPLRRRPAGEPLEVLFYGSYIPLQGVETIVEAARIYRGPPVRWRLVGEGPARSRCEKLARGIEALSFEPPVPYGNLCGRIHRADILLGIFGETPKAGRVIPNKVFQALASGRPVITRQSYAYPAHFEGLAFIPPGDPQALAGQVALWGEGNLAPLAKAAREGYDHFLSSSVVKSQLETALFF